jgi:hypothetical protein
MSQVLSGVRLGNNFSILFGVSDPNSATAPPDVAGAAIDYAYFRLGTNSASTWIYRCSTGATFQNGVLLSAAIWTAK